MLEGIGLTELLLVTVISLIVLGPERLPSALTYVKKYLSKFNRTVREVKEELENELKIAELHQHLRTAEKENRDQITPEIQASVDTLKQAAQSVTRPFDQKQDLTNEAPKKK
jgi:sec-independent protein translocase protein TatB